MKNDLVESKKGKVYSTSIIFSKEFEIAHKHVLEKITNLTVETSAVKNMFIESKYKNDRGREYPIYYMDRDGFMFLVMNTVGKKANEKKLRFIQAFNAMESALINQQDASWIEARNDGKVARLDFTDTVKRFIEYSTEQGSIHAQHYYSNCTKMTYKALELIDQNKSTPIRDMLSRMELGFLMVAENIAQKALEDGMKLKEHYKDIYQFAKKKIEIFSESISLATIKRIK